VTDSAEARPDIRLVPQLLRMRAPCAQIAECYRAVSFPPKPGAEEWTEIVGSAASIHGSALVWMSPEERQMLLELRLPIVVEGLTRAWPDEDIPRAAMRGLLADFIAWMEAQPDHRVLQFCWDVLSARPRKQASSGYAPLLWMKWSGRLRGDISYDNIEVAITLLDEAEAIAWWPPERGIW